MVNIKIEQAILRASVWISSLRIFSWRSFKPSRSRKPCVYFRRKNNSRRIQGSVGGVFGADGGVELKWQVCGINH